MHGDDPCVFVHGLIGPLNDPAMFAALTPADCSAPDLAGYGDSAISEVTLAGQVAALRRHVEQTYQGRPVTLVGHSIGAVYAFTLADQASHLVGDVVTVEGNFTLEDAFWSRSIAAMPADEACSAIQEQLRGVDAFLAGDNIPVQQPWLARATEALNYQPWQTVWQSAIAVVEATGEAEYERMLRRVFDQHPVHLIAGQYSNDSWDVPDWAREMAASRTVMAGVGHMMALAHPGEFGALIRSLRDNHR